MADIIKDVSDTLQTQERYIYFTEADISNSGDIIRVRESLGRPADTITIEIDGTSDLSIRLNSKKQILKRRQYPEEHPPFWADHGEFNLTQSHEMDTGIDAIQVGTGTALTYELNDIPISDVELIYSTKGTFTILLS